MFCAPMPATSSSAMDTDTTGIVFGGQSHALVLPEECHVGVTVEGVEHRVGFGVADLVDDGGEFGGAQRGVVLALDLHAVGRGVGLDDLVGGAREHVVAAYQVDRLRALFLRGSPAPG